MEHWWPIEHHTPRLVIMALGVLLVGTYTDMNELLCNKIHCIAAHLWDSILSLTTSNSQRSVHLTQCHPILPNMFFGRSGWTLIKWTKHTSSQTFEWRLTTTRVKSMWHTNSSRPGNKRCQHHHYWCENNTLLLCM